MPKETRQQLRCRQGDFQILRWVHRQRVVCPCATERFAFICALLRGVSFALALCSGLTCCSALPCCRSCQFVDDCSVVSYHDSCVDNCGQSLYFSMDFERETRSQRCARVHRHCNWPRHFGFCSLANKRAACSR